MPNILTQAQAEAVYSAMCALKSAGVSRMEATIPGTDAHGRKNFASVILQNNGYVVIELSSPSIDLREAHETQSAFATAYGLPQA